MSNGSRDDNDTRVWQGTDLAALAEEQAASGRRARRRSDRSRPSGGGGGGSRSWQLSWRIGLWVVAIALGWFLGTRYFG